MKNRDKEWWIPSTLGLLSVLIVFPLWPGWSGDALIHIIYGVTAAAGKWFEFNPGELSVGSISIGWSALLALCIRLFNIYTALYIQKIILLLSMILLPILIYRFVRYFVSIIPAIFLTSIAILNPGYLLNAPLGMENLPFGVLVASLITTTLIPGQAITAKPRKATLSGFLLGLGCLLRPEGYAVAGILISMAGIKALFAGSASDRAKYLLGLASTIGTLLATIAPLLYFQYYKTGTTVFGSSAQSRLMTARRSSILIGSIWFDPSFSIRLLYYFPILLCLIVASYRLLCRKKEHASSVRENLLAMLFVTWSTYLVYSFVSGSAQLSRYMIFLWPGIIGLCAYLVDELGLWHPPHYLTGIRLALIGGLVWTLVVYSAEAWQRLPSIKRQISAENRTLNMLTYYNDAEVRRNYTDRYLDDFDHDVFPISIVYNEVQIRYYLDDRVKIISADGRTSPLNPTPPFNEDGSVNAEEFLWRYRPDYVVQWVPSERPPGRIVAPPYDAINNLIASPIGTSYRFNSGIRLDRLPYGGISVTFPPEDSL